PRMRQHVGGSVVYSTLVIQVQSPFSAEMFAQYYVVRHATDGCQQQIMETRKDHNMTENIFNLCLERHVRHNRSNLVFLLYCH
ncbi:hypothetical protein GOODEAATRI_004938, partial [Goodea atripinnis]